MIEGLFALTIMAVGMAAAGLYLQRVLRLEKHHRTVSLARQFNLSMDGGTARGIWNGHPMEVRVRDLHRYGGMDLDLRVGGANPRIAITREPVLLIRRLPPPPGPFLPVALSAGYREPDDIVTGDGEFDALIRVKGPIGFGVGILDRETRRLIQAVDGLGSDTTRVWSNGTGIQVKEGWITLRQRDHRAGPDTDIGYWLKLMVELAEALAKRGRARPLDNLLENFRSERDPEVRRVNLACLGAYYPVAPETLEASREALGDPGSDWLRLQGAVNLRREGWPALQALADDSTRLDGVRAAALRALGLSLPPGEAEPLLLAHLDSPDPGLALSAVDTLGDVGRTAAMAARLDRWAGGREEKAEMKIGREAAAKVRARLSGAGPGRLSLEETVEEGRLSHPGEGPDPRP